jgi:integrase
MDRTKMEAYRSQLAGVKLMSLTADKLDAFLAQLPAEKAARTRNGYRTSVIGLFSFLVRKKKLTYNPMPCVTRHQGETKRRRRALSVEELQRLFTAAKERPLAQALTIRRGERKGQRAAELSADTRRQRERDGLQRALVYLTAFSIGFRKKELRLMCVKHLRLDADVPHVFLPGSLTKNGKDAMIPLRPELAGHLRQWVQGKGQEDSVFNVPKYDELLKALKKDLAFAGIPYRDELGRVFDFHSLRKSLGTQLRIAKVDPAASQQFMRHGDIRLTMQIYNDDRLHDLNVEVASKLPAFTL